MTGVSAESGAVRSSTSTEPDARPAASVARIDMEVPSEDGGTYGHKCRADDGLSIPRTAASPGSPSSTVSLR